MKDISNLFNDIGDNEAPLPEFLQIVVTVKRDSDEITISKCLDPQFDLEVLTEAVASLIIVNGKYTESKPEAVLKDVYNKLDKAIKFHGKIIK